jgi:hypothetical protein
LRDKFKHLLKRVLEINDSAFERKIFLIHWNADVIYGLWVERMDLKRAEMRAGARISFSPKLFLAYSGFQLAGS